MGISQGTLSTKKKCINIWWELKRIRGEVLRVFCFIEKRYEVLYNFV